MRGLLRARRAESRRLARAAALCANVRGDKRDRRERAHMAEWESERGLRQQRYAYFLIDHKKEVRRKRGSYRLEVFGRLAQGDKHGFSLAPPDKMETLYNWYRAQLENCKTSRAVFGCLRYFARNARFNGVFTNLHIYRCRKPRHVPLWQQGKSPAPPPPPPSPPSKPVFHEGDGCYVFGKHTRLFRSPMHDPEGLYGFRASVERRWAELRQVEFWKLTDNARRALKELEDLLALPFGKERFAGIALDPPKGFRECDFKKHYAETGITPPPPFGERWAGGDLPRDIDLTPMPPSLVAAIRKA